MVKINKIYTRTGDKGETGLVGGKRIRKDALRVQAYGDIDELNSWLGLVRTHSEKDKRDTLTAQLAQIQNELFDLGSELATPDGESYPGMVTMQNDQVVRLEHWIDQAASHVPELKSFVLPGGTELNGLLHIARTVCRRAERNIISLATKEKVSDTVLAYVNRLSDLFFALARTEAHTSGAQEFLWQPGKK